MSIRPLNEDAEHCYRGSVIKAEIYSNIIAYCGSVWIDLNPNALPRTGRKNGLICGMTVWQ